MERFKVEDRDNRTEKAGSGRSDHSSEIEKEARASFSQKSPLEQALQTGLQGTPQLRKKERSLHLGQLRERIIKALTFEQIEEKGTYPEIGKAIQDPKAQRLVISRQADLEAAAEYIRLARKSGIMFATVDSPKYSGELGLVVVAEEAVDVMDISVPSRKQRLLAKGLPEALIDAVGEDICPRCYRFVEEQAPEEKINYRKQSLFDRLLRSYCPCSSS